MKLDMCILRTKRKCNIIQQLDFQNSHPIKNMKNLNGFSPNQFGEKPCPWEYRVRLMGTVKAFINNSFQENYKVWFQIWLYIQSKTYIKKTNISTCPFELGLLRICVLSFAFPFFFLTHNEQKLHCSCTWIHYTGDKVHSSLDLQPLYSEKFLKWVPRHYSHI